MTTLTDYFDLKAIPQEEVMQTAIISQLMQALHLLLPQYKGNIAVGFPAYNLDKTLGGILRIYGDKESIISLYHAVNKLSNIVDYAILTEPKEIPFERVKGYARFCRKRRKGVSDLRRAEIRFKKRGEWTKEVEENMINKWSKPLIAPHIHMKSTSTGESFTLWISKIPINLKIEERFNSYGLSQKATVPLF